MRSRPFVFSISSVSGGGKTTVTKCLLDQLDRSKGLYFDVYEFEAPDDISKWVEEGKDYSGWNLSPLVEDIENLLSQPGLDFIILDYPFGYLHEGVKKYLDFTIYIDTPLDIAMARRIIRDFTKQNSVEDIQNDMRFYLERGRLAYLSMVENEERGDLVVAVLE